MYKVLDIIQPQIMIYGKYFFEFYINYLKNRTNNIFLLIDSIT